MTPEERFERIEHVTAALVEERRKDREEYRQLRRDTQRHIEELNANIAEEAARTREAIAETNAAVTRLAQETRERIGELVDADRRLRERIDSLVSAMGEYFRQKR